MADLSQFSLDSGVIGMDAWFQCDECGTADLESYNLADAVLWAEAHECADETEPEPGPGHPDWHGPHPFNLLREAYERYVEYALRQQPLLRPMERPGKSMPGSTVVFGMYRPEDPDARA